MRDRINELPWIDPESAGPDGLVGVGGDLRPGTLIRAYSEGVFPWFNEDDPILWWSPDPRTIIELDGLHVSRSLGRRPTASRNAYAMRSSGLRPPSFMTRCASTRDASR